MAGLVPAVHVLLGLEQGKKGVNARRRRAKATPFFERLQPGMTIFLRKMLQQL
jgi:hypothetical protein